MSGRVAINLERFGILVGQDLEFGVTFERPREVVQFAIHTRHDGGVGEAGADAAGDVDRPGSWLNRLRTAVGQPNLNAHSGNFQRSIGLRWRDAVTRRLAL